ncbi:MAG: TetR/AcrR family transcriptional regulator, partial [Propionibacteriales bacterium]|nr:TetR/AcrR family transcriptional regulator [Propionibacteriales bacterium]
AAKGFTRCTIDDIALAAGAGKGTFYRQFESKDHLLGALWQRYIDTLVATVNDHLTDAGNTWSLEMVEATFIELIEIAVAHADLHQLVYSASSGRAHEICREANQQVIGRLADYVQAGADAGLVTATDPRFTLAVLYEGLDARLDHLIAKGDKHQLDTVADRFIPILRNALCPRRKP